MGELRYFSLTSEDLQSNANLVKDKLFSVLIEDGILTQSQAEKYALVINKRGLWGDILERVWKSTDSLSFKVIRLK
jgi:hypothetical protein